MGVASGCGEQEVAVASGSGWNIWVWLLDVVVRRYIDFFILLIPTPLVYICSFLQQHPFFFLCFSFLCKYYHINIIQIFFINSIIHIITLHTIHAVHMLACTVWLLGDGTSVLPDGVSVNGSSLVIATAQRIHSNTYICTSTNITGQRETSANISVFCEYSY